MKIMRFQLHCVVLYLIFYSCLYLLIKLPVLNLKLVNIVYGAVVEGDLSFQDIGNSWFLLQTIATSEHTKCCQNQKKTKTPSFFNCLTVNCEIGASFDICQRKERH